MAFIGRAVAPAPISANDVPDLPASKITTGTFADARISSSSVSQHATSFDDNKIVNDLSTLGLRVHTQENLNASNTNSASFDVFQDSSGITNLTNTTRTTEEYVASASESVSSISITSSNYSTYFGTQAQSSTSQGFMISQTSGTGTVSTLSAFNPSNTFNTMTTGSYSDVMLAMFTAGSNFGPSNYSLVCQGAGPNRYYWRLKFKSDYVGFKPTSNYFIWRNGSSYASDMDIVAIDESNNVTILDNTISGVPTNNQGYTTSSISGSTYYPEIAFAISYSQQNGYGWDNYIIGGDIKTLTTSATGSFEGNAITVSSTSSMGAVITYQDQAGTNALNTDIILKLSADNGSNYSTATLTALPDFATGIKMAKVNDLSVTAGTQLKYKIEFANQSSGSKEARIRGVSLQY